MVHCEDCGLMRKKFNNWNSDGPTCKAFRKAMGIERDFRVSWLKFLERCWHPVGSIPVIKERDEQDGA